LLVTAGTTAAINLTYVNGWVDSVVLNVGTITGSATASVASTVTTKAYGISPGAGDATVTVPSSGVSVLQAFIDTDLAGPTVTTWTGTFSASADKDQWSGVAFNLTGSMTHVTATSAIVNLTSVTNNGGTWGWIGVNFQP
jgi:hypothetical protein